MFSKITSIDICIATYKRPEGLKKLLESIKLQHLSENLKLRLIVIDNDPEKSAQNVVYNVFLNSDINYIYDIQPEKNIALTRNKALEYAIADYIIFIDDDEWVKPDWIEILLETSQKYNADVVFGSVIQHFPPDTPEWIIKGGFFNRSNKTGTNMCHGATGNTLVRNSIKFHSIIKFDSEYGLTGGSDTELFHRMYNNGAKLIWCNEAPAYEKLAYERMTVKWLILRALRGGQVYAKVFIINQSLLVKLAYITKRLMLLIFSSLLLPISMVLGKSRWVWVLRKIMANVGALSMFFSKRMFQEYK
jgi:succinoglycan biosynthesis protein ExoM